MEEQKQQIEAIRDYWNQRANGFALAVDEELRLEEAETWERRFRQTIQRPGAEVLDDGTGAGFFPVILSRMGCKVTAIDYSDEMVAQAKQRFKDLGLSVDVRQMDAQHLTFADASFDAVVSRNVLWNLDDPAAAYREIHRVLRPGGVLILEDGNMYLYMNDAEYAALHEAQLEKRKQEAAQEGGLHGKHNVDHVDFSIIEKIAGTLSISKIRRPQWDFEQLIKLGFDDIHVTVMGETLPMGFRITARKKEVRLA